MKSGTSPSGPGSSPVLTNTWKPLQMPIIGLPAPMNLVNSSRKENRILLPINRPLPKWSPKENPPGTASMS